MLKIINFLPTEFFTYLKNLKTSGSTRNNKYIFKKLDLYQTFILNGKYIAGIFSNINHFHSVLIHQYKEHSFNIYFFNSLPNESDKELYKQVYDVLGFYLQRKIRDNFDENYIFKNRSTMFRLKCPTQKDGFRCGYFCFLGKG